MSPHKLSPTGFDARPGSSCHKPGLQHATLLPSYHSHSASGDESSTLKGQELITLEANFFLVIYGTATVQPSGLHQHLASWIFRRHKERGILCSPHLWLPGIPLRRSVTLPDLCWGLLAAVNQCNLQKQFQLMIVGNRPLEWGPPALLSGETKQWSSRFTASKDSRK